MANEISASPLPGDHAFNRLINLYNVKKTSDVTFAVGSTETEFFGHTLIIGAASEVFQAQFSGDWKDSRNVSLKDVKEEVFESLMMYIYKDVIKVKGEHLMDLLELAHRYKMTGLLSALTSQATLMNHHSEHVWQYLMFATEVNDTSLKMRCIEFIDRDAKNLILLPDFLDISSSTVELIIARDSFILPEMKLFQRLVQWSVAECERSEPTLDVTPGNQRKVMNSFILKIRFPLMTLEELASVEETGILTKEEINCFTISITCVKRRLPVYHGTEVRTCGNTTLVYVKELDDNVCIPCTESCYPNLTYSSVTNGVCGCNKHGPSTSPEIQ